MGTELLPRRWQARLQLVAALAVALLAFAGTAAVRVYGATADALPLTDVAARADEAPLGAVEPAGVGAAGASAVVPADPPPTTFTLGDLAAGRVSQAEQDRFWQVQLEAILAAPCTPAAAGATPVTLFVGADEAWTERLTAATRAHAEACAGR